MPRPIRIEYTIPAGAQFGAPRAGGSRTHQGCDYHCPIGTPIYGTGPGGVVVAHGYQPDPGSGAGNYVTVKYGDRRTTDMHMREATPLPNGALVGPDTIVGYVGLTGNAVNASPPGSHDHHQVTINGRLADPETYYGAETASLDATPLIDQIGYDMPKVILHTTYDAAGNKTGVLNYLVGEVTLKELRLTRDIETAVILYGPATAVDSPKWDMLVSMVTENIAALRGSTPVAAIDYAALAAELAKVIPKPPTAEQNGAAARAAIVR